MLTRASALFVFWVVLSGRFDAFHLTLGAASAVVVAWSTRGLGDLAPKIAGRLSPTWARWPAYLPWLAWQIVQEWLSVSWGPDRHARRVAMITDIERSYVGASTGGSS